MSELIQLDSYLTNKTKKYSILTLSLLETETLET